MVLGYTHSRKLLYSFMSNSIDSRTVTLIHEYIIQKHDNTKIWIINLYISNPIKDRVC